MYSMEPDVVRPRQNESVCEKSRERVWLELLIADDLVEKRSEQRFCLTQKAFDCLQRTQTTVDCKWVLEPREDIALEDCTTHELLC